MADSMKRLILIVIGVVALSLGGLYLALWLSLGTWTHPEYLAALRDDPMAQYIPLGAAEASRREREAADTWMGYQAATIDVYFAVELGHPGSEVFARAIADALAAGWRVDEGEHAPQSAVQRTLRKSSRLGPQFLSIQLFATASNAQIWFYFY
jgi:hypothetical protein